MANADIVFTPSTALEERVLAGDRDGTLAVLQAMGKAERARHRASLNRMIKLMWESGWRRDEGRLVWPTSSTDEQESAVNAAILLCGTASDIADSRARAADVLALLPGFEIPCLPELGDAWLAANTRHILDVQALVAAGAIARPEGDNYAHALMALPRQKFVNGKWSTPSLRESIAADPGLPQALLRMFEVEGDSELSLANADKYGPHAWGKHLLDLMHEGVLERAALLDRTLAALERDWLQYRAGWFKQFHEKLAPTPGELGQHAARYLQLCHSRIPPTVTLAVDAIAVLHAGDTVSPDAVVAALAPVFATGNKSQVEVALKLLDRCVANAPALLPEASRIAAIALVHEAAPLQAKVLQRLEKWPLDASLRDVLRRHLPGIAASHRGRLLQLIGDELAPAKPASDPASLRAPTVRAMPLDADRAIAPIAGLDELVQAIAYVFENDTDTDALERAFGALVAAAPIAAGDRAAFAPVCKRVAKLKSPVAFELGRLLAFALDGGRLPPQLERDSGRLFRPLHRRLSARTDALMDLVAHGKSLQPLSTPTHRRGFIAPRELVRRQSALEQARATTTTSEQVLALLRLPTHAGDDDRAAARTLPDSPFARALRYALGDELLPGAETALYCAAARIRHPGSDDALLLAKVGDIGPDGPRAARYGWSFEARHAETYTRHEIHLVVGERGDDVGDLLAIERHPVANDRDQPRWARPRPLAGLSAALVAWSATLVPSDMEAFFAEGARTMGDNLDWWEAQWQNKEYQRPLLDATVAAGEMARLVLACGLLGKEPG
ncbi:MAG: DUF6493 family protein, partial [Arenimonas sp.]